MKVTLLLAIALMAAYYSFGQTLQDAKVELFNTNDTVARNMLFDLLNKNGSSKTEAAYYLGIDYSYLRQYDSAALFLQMAISGGPEKPLASIARARLALIHGDTATAETELAKALSLAPDNADVYLEVGNVYDEFTNRKDKAITVLEKALSIDPKNSFITITLASACAQQGETAHNASYFTENVELQEKTRALNNRFTVTWLREGGDLTKLADYNIDDLRKTGVLKRILKALSRGQTDDDKLASRELLADSTIKNMLLDSAVVCLTKAVKSTIKISNAWLLLGNAEYKLHYPTAEIIKAYEAANSLRNDRYYDACFNLGIVYSELNDLENADENLKCAYYLRSDSVAVRFMIAQNYAKLNRPELVEYWMKKGLEVKKPDAEDYYLVGTGFGKVGHNLKKAIEYLEKAVELNPTRELFYEDLGVAYGLNGQYNQAINTSKKLRGGGEEGEDWHVQGRGLKKQNSFDDFIAAAEYLTANGYTTKEKLAIEGGSNGGLLVGAVLTQRPDLFKAAVAHVGVYDMLRYQKFTGGRFWIGEYGVSTDSIQFKNLIHYSPLHNVKEGVNYPATLLFTAENDDRVPPFHSYKFLSTLQQKSAGSEPHILYFEEAAGHAGPRDNEKAAAQKAFELAFIFEQLKLRRKTVN